MRSAPGVLLPAWQGEFGWNRALISLAAAIGTAAMFLVGGGILVLRDRLQRVDTRRVHDIQRHTEHLCDSDGPVGRLAGVHRHHPGLE